MTDEERRRLNKFGMGGDPNVLYGGEDDQGYAIQQVVAPVGEAEAKQPALTEVKTAAPTTNDETTDLADQYTAAVKQNEKDWQDYVLGVAERNRQQQEEMRQQERADRMAGTATGLTEMAANIANLLTVGQGHATPQQYHNFSLDWMRKADQDMRERRHRTDNMNAQLDRLNYQIQQVKNADRLSDIKLRIEAERQAQQQAEAQRQAEEKEKQRLAQQKETRDASMLKSGFVPDDNDPSGYRFDPNLAQRMADAKRAPKGGSSAGRTSSGQSAPAAASRSTSGNVGTTSAPSKPASPAAAPAASRDTTRIDTSSAAAQLSAETGLSKEASEALARFFAAGGTPEMLKSAETNGNGNRRSGRTTFLPPTEKDWNRGIDKKNSPQGRKKVPAPGKDEWSQYKI